MNTCRLYALAVLVGASVQAGADTGADVSEGLTGPLWEKLNLAQVFPPEAKAESIKVQQRMLFWRHWDYSFSPRGKPCNIVSTHHFDGGTLTYKWQFDSQGRIIALIGTESNGWNYEFSTHFFYRQNRAIERTRNGEDVDYMVYEFSGRKMATWLFNENYSLAERNNSAANKQGLFELQGGQLKVYALAGLIGLRTPIFESLDDAGYVSSGFSGPKFQWNLSRTQYEVTYWHLEPPRTLVATLKHHDAAGNPTTVIETTFEGDKKTVERLTFAYDYCNSNGNDGA